jgi:NhaP-type Na+/H+ or K+/H+ antiporter
LVTFVLSAALVLIGGYFAGKLAQRTRMPPLLGMLIFGILVGPSVLGLDVYNLDGGLTLTNNGNWLTPIPALSRWST